MSSCCHNNKAADPKPTEPSVRKTPKTGHESAASCCGSSAAGKPAPAHDHAQHDPQRTLHTSSIRACRPPQYGRGAIGLASQSPQLS